MIELNRCTLVRRSEIGGIAALSLEGCPGQGQEIANVQPCAFRRLGGRRVEAEVTRRRPRRSPQRSSLSVVGLGRVYQAASLVRGALGGPRSHRGRCSKLKSNSREMLGHARAQASWSFDLDRPDALSKT